MRKEEQNQIPVNQPLLNTIAPVGIEFTRNELYLGETIAGIWGITKYPTNSNVGWAAKMNKPNGSVTCQTFIPCDSNELLDALNKNINKYNGIAETTKDNLVRQRALRTKADCERLLERIDNENETVGYMSNLVMPIGANRTQYSRSKNRIVNALAGLQFKVRNMAFLQKEAFKAMSPYYTNQEEVDNLTKTVVPISTLAGGLAMASSGYTDRKGSWFFKDRSGGLCMIDIWRRGGDRTNSNGAILGGQGLGKSTIAKSLMQSEYATGTKIIVIDPDREFKDLCNNLKGDWIDCGGGSNGVINPLEIRPVPRDNDIDDVQADRVPDELCLYKDEGHGIGAMALHLKTLEVFFELYIPDLTNMQKALLKQALIELYNNFGIDWDTDVNKLSSKHYPIMRDLYELIAAKAGKEKAYEDLKYLLHDIAMGSDSFIWNGHTTVEPTAQFICLDTYQLNGMSDKIKKTQYFNTLSWIWDLMSKDRTERVLLFCDENYLMVDPRVPQTLIFLRNICKRDRKYEAGLWVITHSVVDYLDPAVKMYGQALLDIPCFKVIMGTDGQNLKEIKELYNLKDAEEEALLAKKRGEAIMFIGSKRLPVTFMGSISPKRLARMGTAGGR